MDIGSNEMSQKIRSAIKAKLVDLGSYVDDELPDYIMVMIANKKSQAQMTDDLSLFLGNNTLAFTSWLHSVMDKLSKSPSDSKPKKVKEHATKSKKAKEKKSVLPNPKQGKGSEAQSQPVKSDRATASSSVVPPDAAQEPPVVAAMTATKPDPSQDVITLKPETNDFLDEELAQEAMASEVTKKQSAVISPIHTVTKEKQPSPHAEKGRPVPRKSVDKKSPISSHPPVSIKVSPTLPTSRKRKAPGSVIGQVLNVEEEEDSDEPVSFGKKVASTVLPQRRPTLPVTKQANTSLLKKAVSAAEASTNQVLSAQIKQSAPKVAPKRFKIIRKLQPSPPRRNLLLKAVEEAKESISRSRQPQGLAVQPSIQVEMPATGLVSRSRIMEVAERDYDAQEFMTVSTRDLTPQQQVEEYYADDEDQDDTESPDSRHICLSTETTPPQTVYIIDEESTDQRPTEPVYKPTPLAAAQSELPQRPVSPKFIVTLEGAMQPKAKTKQRKSARVAPRLSFTRTIDNSMMYSDYVQLQQQQQQQLEDELVRQRQEELALQEVMLLQQRKQQLLLLQQQQQQAAEDYCSRDDQVAFAVRKPHMDQTEDMQLVPEEEYVDEEEEAGPSKKEKSTAERCMFWPACKNGSDCLYVHPTTPCRTFPKCKFGDKCLFIHPNCKYDSRCTRPNCPFTHATRKQGHSVPTSPPAVLVSPAPVHVSPQVCKFHPNCTNAHCTFLHPKMCLFGRGCTRTGCTFTHPQVATGAALKWSKPTHISDRPFVAKDS